MSSPSIDQPPRAEDSAKTGENKSSNQYSRHNTWTPERVEQLIRLWAEGFSASQIAAEMGCFVHCRDGGRCSVLGKVFRLNLPPRLESHTIRGIQQKITRLRAEKKKRVYIRRPASCVIPTPRIIDDLLPALNVTLAALAPHQCRAVTDQSEWGRALYCGHPTHGASAYCAPHYGRFFVPEAPKKARAA